MFFLYIVISPIYHYFVFYPLVSRTKWNPAQRLVAAPGECCIRIFHWKWTCVEYQDCISIFILPEQHILMCLQWHQREARLWSPSPSLLVSHNSRFQGTLASSASTGYWSMMEDTMILKQVKLNPHIHALHILCRYSLPTSRMYESCCVDHQNNI